jgi:hypothetical protein
MEKVFVKNDLLSGKLLNFCTKILWKNYEIPVQIMQILERRPTNHPRGVFEPLKAKSFRTMEGESLKAASIQDIYVMVSMLLAAGWIVVFIAKIKDL